MLLSWSYQEERHDKGWVKHRTMTAGAIDDTLRELGLYVKHGILRLQETWKDIGVSEEEQGEKCQSVIQSIRSMLDSVVIGEEAWRDCIEEEVSELAKGCNQCYCKLGLPSFDQSSVTLALLPKRTFLSERQSELEQLIDATQIKVTELESRKNSCLKKLGQEEDRGSKGLITSAYIDSLQLRIKELEEDMSIRKAALEEQLSTIASLMETLEMDRCSTLTEDILNVDTEGAILSDDYLAKREHVIHSLRDQLTENKHVSQELKRDVTRLHRLIYRDQSIPDPIEQLFHSSKPSNINQLKDILNNLNKMKNDNLEKYIVGLEEEINIFHKLCFQTKYELSSEESIASADEKSDILKPTTSTLDISEIIIDDVGSKENFVIRNAEIPREAQVRNLEEELESWEKFYQSNKCIFELITKWKDLNDRYLAMESPSPDKYNNRGGCLLRMQKEAARLLREIPKLEAEILAEVEKLNGETIKINGLFVEDYFSEYRATTSLNRQSSMRRSRRKSTNKPSPKVETQVVKKEGTPEPSQLKVNPGVRRSMRKSVRESRDGLDKIKPK